MTLTVGPLAVSAEVFLDCFFVGTDCVDDVRDIGGTGATGCLRFTTIVVDGVQGVGCSAVGERDVDQRLLFVHVCQCRALPDKRGQNVTSRDAKDLRQTTSRQDKPWQRTEP